MPFPIAPPIVPMLAKPTRLQPGDRIYLGPYIIIFQPDETPSEDLAMEVTAQ